jgi:D-alanine-D-alanine ligase
MSSKNTLRLAEYRRLAQAAKHELAGKNVWVVKGGDAPERSISLHTGAAVERALAAAGLRCTSVDLTGPKSLERFFQEPCDLVFNALHGPGGEDGKLQGLLEWLRIPYTGSGMLASALAMNKARAKACWRSAGLPTADWVLVRQGDRLPVLPPGWPKVVKPNDQGSAIGVSVVAKRSGLEAALAEVWKYSRQALVENFCPGREISIGVVREQVLPVIEIVPKKAFYDFEAKYAPGMSEHILPARLSPQVTLRCQKIAWQAHQALGCRGASRIDLIVGRGGKPMLLEANTLPGMTGTSLLPEAANAWGLDFETLVLLLLADAWERSA